MRVFFRFRDTQLSQSGIGNDFAENVAQLFGRKDRFDKTVVIDGILRHADDSGEINRFGTFEFVEFRIGQRVHDFACTVGTEVREQQSVAVIHAVIIADNGRQDEFVVNFLFIGSVNGFFGRVHTHAVAQH